MSATQGLILSHATSPTRCGPGIVSISPNGRYCGVVANGNLHIREKQNGIWAVNEVDAPSTSAIDLYDDGCVLGHSDGSVGVLAFDSMRVLSFEPVHQNSIHSIKKLGRFTISASYDGRLLLFDMNLKQMVWEAALSVNALHCSSSKILVCNKSGLKELGMDGQFQREWDLRGGCHGAVRLDGDVIIACTPNGLVRISKSGMSDIVEGDFLSISSVSSNHVVVGDTDGQLQVFSTEGAMVARAKGHFSGVSSLSVSNEATIASTSPDGRFGLWGWKATSLEAHTSLPTHIWNGRITCAHAYEGLLTVAYQSGLVKIYAIAEETVLSWTKTDSPPVCVTANSSHCVVASSDAVRLFRRKNGELQSVVSWNLPGIRCCTIVSEESVLAINEAESAFLLDFSGQWADFSLFDGIVGCACQKDELAIVAYTEQYEKLNLHVFNAMSLSEASPMAHTTFELREDSSFSLVESQELFGDCSSSIVFGNDDIRTTDGIGGYVVLHSTKTNELQAVARLSSGMQHPTAFEPTTGTFLIGVGSDIHSWKITEGVSVQAIEDSSESLLFSVTGRVEWLFLHGPRLIVVAGGGGISVHYLDNP